MFDY